MQPKMLATHASQVLGVSGQAILKKIKQGSLPHGKSQNRVYFGHESAKEIFKFQFKPTIASVQIVKGGTGKTAITQSIAICASLYGARVLCIDLDQQGNLTQSFGVNDDSEFSVMINVVKRQAELSKELINICDGLHLFPSNIRNATLEYVLLMEGLPVDRVYKEILDPLRSYYDLILIDCPPALGRSVAAAALASDYVIAPVTPEKSSITGLEITYQALKEESRKYQRGIELKILQNKFDNRTILSHSILTHLLEHPSYKNCLFGTCVRQTQDFPNSFYSGSSVFESLKNSTAKEDIDSITREILGILPRESGETKNLRKVSLEIE